MARELYNWDQVRAYSVIAVENLKRKNENINIDTKEFISELNTLQTRYGKDGVIGLANRLMNKNKHN